MELPESSVSLVCRWDTKKYGTRCKWGTKCLSCVPIGALDGSEDALVLQTGFIRAGASPQYDYVLRRVALRSSWFPNSRNALDEMYRTRGIVVRFIIGHTKLAADEAALGAEEREFGGFLRLPIEVGPYREILVQIVRGAMMKRWQIAS